jgi:hypothetical protein
LSYRGIYCFLCRPGARFGLVERRTIQNSVSDEDVKGLIEKAEDYSCGNWEVDSQAVRRYSRGLTGGGVALGRWAGDGLAWCGRFVRGRQWQ